MKALKNIRNFQDWEQLAAPTIFPFVSVMGKTITMNYLKELNTVNTSIDLQRGHALYISPLRWM